MKNSTIKSTKFAVSLVATILTFLPSDILWAWPAELNITNKSNSSYHINMATSADDSDQLGSAKCKFDGCPHTNLDSGNNYAPNDQNLHTLKTDVDSCCTKVHAHVYAWATPPGQKSSTTIGVCTFELIPKKNKVSATLYWGKQYCGSDIYCCL